MPEPASTRPRTSRRRKLLLAFASAALTLGALEAALWLLAPLPAVPDGQVHRFLPSWTHNRPLPRAARVDPGVLRGVTPGLVDNEFNSLKVDFSVNLAGKEFDTDQTAMADRFDGGNSTTPGCLGTYRNGSDATTGLVYSGTPAAGCDPGANTGWTGSNPLGTVGDFATLDFTFSDFNDGEVFEFDCDTDGAGGISGDAMAGTVITVTLADGTVLSGTLSVSGAASATLNL